MSERRRMGLSRRTTLAGIVAGAGATAAALVAPSRGRASAQESTTTADQCVATAPPLDATGIGFVSLLVGGIVPDMPPGPVEVRIFRLAMAPGASIPAAALPYPALMYIETGTTACPGGAGRVGYGADGEVIEVTTGEGIQYTPAGSTQYIPANVADGAGNEAAEMMSSIVIEFVPVAGGGTPTAST
jgi:hypothetical protein